MPIRPRLPRLESGELLTERVANSLSEEIDNLGVSITVARTSAVAFAANAGIVLPWQQVRFHTRDDMFNAANPYVVRVRVAGTYKIHLRVRWSGFGGGSSLGTRYCYILRNNGTDPSDILAADEQPGVSAYDEGVDTWCERSSFKARTNDFFYAYVGSTVAVTGAHLDFGGTVMTLTRLGPTGGAAP